MTRQLATQVRSLSAERGDLLSGARDAYLQYIGRLEARLREKELAVVDQRLVRSERQRFEAEANLAQVDDAPTLLSSTVVKSGCGPRWCDTGCDPMRQRLRPCRIYLLLLAYLAHARVLVYCNWCIVTWCIETWDCNLAQVDEQEQRKSRVSQIEASNLERASAAAHKPRPPKAPRQEASEAEAAPSRADRTSGGPDRISVGSDDAGSDPSSDAGSSAEPDSSKGLSAARALFEGLDVDDKLKLAAELQEGMTPQELRQALVDIIERLAKGDKSGKMLGATLKQAMTTLHPREKFSLLQAASPSP